MPGPTSKTSSDLAQVRFQLKSGKTRKGRPLEPEEVSAMEEKRDRMVAQMRAGRQKRFLGRIADNTTSEADRVIREVPQAVQQCITDELDKRLGPALASAMEEALAQRRWANKRIRELRKQEKGAAYSEELCEGVLANASLAGRENDSEPAAFEATPPSGEGVELTSPRGLEQEVASPEDIGAIRAGYHADWLPDSLRRGLWDYTLTRQPYLVKFRGHDVKTRPKNNSADPTEHGEYPLYRWGQERQSYDLVESVPPPARAVMDYIEAQFGDKTNLAMATYYWNGTEQYIPIHRDKKVTTRSEGAWRQPAASSTFPSELSGLSWQRRCQALAKQDVRTCAFSLTSLCSQETSMFWKGTSTSALVTVWRATRQ